MQFVFPTKFCINIVFNFLWGLTVANKTYAKFCGEDKLHHGERVRWKMPTTSPPEKSCQIVWFQEYNDIPRHPKKDLS